MQTHKGGGGTAPPIRNLGARKAWVVSTTPWTLYPHERQPVPIVQEDGCPPGPVWTGTGSQPHWDPIPGPLRSQRVAKPTELSRPTICIHSSYQSLS